jgi:hypothetical protein
MLAAEGGSFGPEVHYGAGDSPRALTVADINSDGRPDLAVTNPTSFGVSVLLNGPVAITRTMHVGNIDSHAKPGPDGSTWQLLVQIRTDNEAHAAAPAGTLVSGSWEDRTLASCATEILGSCVIGRFGIAAASGSATFRVTGLSNPAYPEHGYGPADNHDPTGDSDGTSITVYRP